MKRVLTHHLLNSASRYPDRNAFKQLKTKITYTDLVSKANQVARHLINTGTQKGDRVGIFMNRSIESSYAVYGILMSGSAYVPIDTNLPTHRILTLINDCEINTILTTETFKKQISGLLAANSTLRHIVGIEHYKADQITGWKWEDIFSLDDTSVDINNQEDDLAYIIYTSGTTGHPKGIVHTHYSGGSYAKLSADLYQVTHEDILGNHSHLHYDISTMGYLTMPYAGGCTVIVPEAHTIFPTSLARLIAEEQLTIWYSVPLALIQLIQSGQLDLLDYSHLRWILFGGEAFALKHINHLRKCLPHVAYSNVYGPAEVNQCTYYNFDKDTHLEEPIPIGSIWGETDISIIKDNPQSESGELIVASSTQMLGYWNQPQRTSDSFIHQSDAQGQQRRYYRTGDIGSIDSDGDLMFAGRKDRQVKVRGHRVELNEIESLILRNEHIQEVAVYATKEEDANAIYAIVRGKFDNFDPQEIQQYLSSLLPSHSIPKTISAVESIPRTPAGKVDYKALTQ